MGRTVFSDQSRKQLRHKRIGYDLNGKLEILLLRFFVVVLGVKSLGDVSPYMRSYYF